MPNSRRITAHPYAVEVVLYQTPEAMARGAFRSKESREELVDLAEGCNGLFQANGSWAHVGVFNASRATLVHELIHAGIHILQRAGIDPLHASGEPLCYLVDNLYTRLEKSL